MSSRKRSRWSMVCLALMLCTSILVPTVLADMQPESIHSKKIVDGPIPLYKDGTNGQVKLMNLYDGQIVGFPDSISYDPDWVMVTAWDEDASKLRRGWVKTGHFAAITPDRPFTQSVGEVISRTASLREGPSIDATKLITLSNGAKFLFIRHEGDWAFVHHDAKDGKVYEGYVRSELVVEKSEHLVCNAEDIPAYAYPSLDAKAVSSLSKGTSLTILAELDDFWVVSLRTAAACISKDDDVYVEEREK